MKIIVTGATGLAGAEVVREAIKNPVITEICAIARKPLAIQHLKLKTIIHNDFLNYDSLKATFKNYEACLWCLGISQTQVSIEQYEVITFDYTIAAAKAMLGANSNIKFIFLSGAGADSTEKSKTIFARVKGKTENELFRMPFKNLVCVRPGGIIPINKNPNAPFAYKLMYPLFPLMGLLMPNKTINSVRLSNSMLNIAVKNISKPIIENIELLELGKN